MVTPSRRSILEVLESRIAPATFWVSGTSAEIDNVSGLAQAGDSEAASDAGADHAILLQPGDKLLFNPDGNVATRDTDYNWVTVVAGKALVFLTDLNGDARYSLDELTGLAVSDHFSGSVFSDIHGSVATMLDGDGHFTSTKLERASIAKLTISGALTSSNNASTNILAGLGISNVTVAGQSLDGLSVNGIVATGSQALRSSWSFGGASFSFNPTEFDHVVSSSGGDIVNAHFTGGLLGILTGDGEETTDDFTGKGGPGGSIVNVTTGISPEGFLLQAGRGGTSYSGGGGAGGGISGFHGAFHSSDDTAVQISTGAGGDGAGGNGGAGGSIVNSTFRDLDAAFSFKVLTGAGGISYSRGHGSSGGSVVNTSIVLLGDLGTTEIVGGSLASRGGNLDILLGSGGSAQPSFIGETSSYPAGAGGSWVGSSLTAQGIVGFQLLAGSGGESIFSAGGAGGAVLGGHFHFNGALGLAGDGVFRIVGGDGGGGTTGGVDGGRIEGSDFSFLRSIAFGNGGFLVKGGDGAALAKSGDMAQAGSGGALKRNVFDFHETVAVGGGLSFLGGTGGEHFALFGLGGNGGSIDALAILSTGDITSELKIRAGDGGTASSEGGPASRGGGAGGNVFNLLMTAPDVTSLILGTGHGGNAELLGTGGRAGNFSTGLGLFPRLSADPILAAKFHTPAGVFVSGGVGTFELTLGEGGTGSGETPNSAAGGKGGSLLNARFVLGSVTTDLSVLGGGGGLGSGSATGGISGGISHASFRVAGDVGGEVRIALDNGGPSDVDARTGSGGSYSFLDLGIGGSVEDAVAVIAPSAGNVGDHIGGDGGSIDHLRLDVGDILGGEYPPAEVFAPIARYSLQVIAGSGYDGVLGGAGGGITNSSVLTKSLEYSACVLAGFAGDSHGGAGASGGSLVRNTMDFRGDMGGSLYVYSGQGGSAEGVAAAGRAGAISATSITLQSASAVNIFAGTAGTATGGAGASGGAIVGLTLENTGFVQNVSIVAGAGTLQGSGFQKAGAGGAIVGSTYTNRGGAGVVEVTAGLGGVHTGDTPFSRGNAGAGGALASFTFNNEALLDTALLSAGDGGGAFFSGEGGSGSGGNGGAVTGFTLHDTAGPDSVVSIHGGKGGDRVGAVAKSGNGGAVVKTRIETLGTVTVLGGMAGGQSEYGVLSVGGAGGWVSGVTGSVGHLSVIAGNGSSAFYGGPGGSVRGVILSEVSGFVRVIQAGDGGGGQVAGRGGSISRVSVPGDIGDFHSAYNGPAGDGLEGMGGLVAGQGGPRDAIDPGPAGNVSYVTANRIAAIYASLSFDGTLAVASIIGVRAHEIGADTGIAGTGEVPGLRGYGTFTYEDRDGNHEFSMFDIPIDGGVFVRASGFNAKSLSVLPLFLVQSPG